MEKVKEELEFSIKETNNIKDMIITLNTLQGFTSGVETEKINGEIKAIIIKTNKATQIEISLVEYPDVILFEDVNFIGTKYLAIKTQAISDKHELFNYSTESWFLNNALQISIKGAPNTETKIIIRYK